MNLTHKIRLQPTRRQASYFAAASGTARFVWNWALAEWDKQYAAGEQPSATKLKAQFNRIKYASFPWLSTIHRDAHAQPFANLGKAFHRFFRGASRRPRFKSKHSAKNSFYIANDRLSLCDGFVTLPVVGTVRLSEPLRLDGKIMSAVVSQEAECWYISVAVDVGDYQKDRTSDYVAGIDLGIATLATIDNGQIVEQVANPKALTKAAKQLRRANRVLARRKRGSRNRQKAKNRLARVHARVRNVRQDCLHKLTTKLCRENQAVVIEDLCVKGMLKNRRLARAISDVSFYEIRRQLTYKAEIYGTKVIVADRWFPSSKLCSHCGKKNENLKLSDRVFKCPACGHTQDRDSNAAANLRTLGLRETHACRPEGSGPPRKRKVKPCRVEAGTRPTRKSQTRK